MCRPVTIYSTAWVTMNVRGLMNFLSLRTKHEDATYPSYPQWEINRVADLMEIDFKDKFPLIHGLFRQAGSVCP
jgi:thymidylate synthase (FAD)